jgi:hypothetical protein
MGMPDGGIQKYVLDSKSSRLILLGVDGKYYSVDETGYAKRIDALETPANHISTGEDVPNRSQGEIKDSEGIHLDDDGYGRFILHAGKYSKVLLKASLLNIDLPEPDGAILLHWDKLGPIGRQLLARIARNGSELWTAYVDDLVSRPILSGASISLVKMMMENSDVIVFLEESANQNRDHITHVYRLDGKSGNSVWSTLLKN